MLTVKKVRFFSGFERWGRFSDEPENVSVFFLFDLIEDD